MKAGKGKEYVKKIIHQLLSIVGNEPAGSEAKEETYNLFQQ